MNKLQKSLMAQNPYMKCRNSMEFKQRLQWLSEGMLRNHMESIIHYSINFNEIAQYKAYKDALKNG